MDKDELAAAVKLLQRLYSALPYWDNTAKLHGKVTSLAHFADSWDGHADLAPLLMDVTALDAEVARLHERDPLTQLHRHLSAWRARLEEVQRASSAGVGRSTAAAVAATDHAR